MTPAALRAAVIAAALGALCWYEMIKFVMWLAE